MGSAPCYLHGRKTAVVAASSESRAEQAGSHAPERRAAGRVHVAIGPVCNNNCLFCMEEDRAQRERINGALTTEDVRSILESGRGAEEVCFTSGEPTLVEELPRYLGWAKEVGYPKVSVTTNGRRLAYEPYCAELVRAGMNLVYVSIHGHDTRLHDALVRTPGAFEQAHAGLVNAVRLSDRGLRVHTSTVVAKQNLPHLSDIYRFLRGRGADQVVFNALQANGRAHTHFERVFPRYQEIVAAFVQLLEGESEPEPPVFLVDVPLCMTESIPALHRGWVEEYVHHEVVAAVGNMPTPPEIAPRLVERSRAQLDDARRSKRTECGQCRYDYACRGVWTNYVTRYGWNEFVPVPPTGGAAAGRST